MAKRLLHPQRDLRKPEIMHPARDWIIGLLTALLIFIAGAAWSTHVYLKYRDLSVEETSNVSTEVVVYRESLVKAALDEFAGRVTEHQRLLQAQQHSNSVGVKPVVAAEEATSTPAVTVIASSTPENVPSADTESVEVE